MNTNMKCDKVKSLLRVDVTPQIDQLSADELDDMERHLNECESCAAVLAGMPADLPPALADEVEIPSGDQWDDAWHLIENELNRGHRLAGKRHRRGVRAVAIALVAALALAVSAQFWFPDRGAPVWEFQLATAEEVDIESIEVFGDQTPILLDAAVDRSPIIWIVPEKGES